MSLKREYIQSWRDLDKAFVKPYKYNIDMEPDRKKLQSMKIKDKETFKEYARR